MDLEDPSTILLIVALLAVFASRGGGGSSSPVQPFIVAPAMVWTVVADRGRIEQSGYYRVPTTTTEFTVAIPSGTVAVIAIEGMNTFAYTDGLVGQWQYLGGSRTAPLEGATLTPSNCIMVVFRNEGIYQYATTAPRLRFAVGGGLANTGTLAGNKALSPSVAATPQVGVGADIPVVDLGPYSGTIDLCSLQFYGTNGGGTNLAADFSLFRQDNTGAISIIPIGTTIIDQTGVDPRRRAELRPNFNFNGGDMLCVQWTAGAIGPGAAGILWRCEYSRAQEA